MIPSPLIPRHEAAGARLRETAEGAEVLTYGDVPAEYRAGTEGCLLLDECARGELRVRGSDRSEFLHRLLANDVRGLAPGEGNRNLLLSPKGKILFDLDLAQGEDEVRLTTAPGRAGALRTALDMYLFSDDVELADASDEVVSLALCGPGARRVVAAVLGDAELPPAEPAHRWIDLPRGSGVVRVTALPVAGSPGLRLDAAPDSVGELWDALVAAGARPGGIVARDILRCEAGAALWGADVDDGIYPQEARLEDGFSLTKGCYIGQEVVAKIDTYQGLNKRLVALAVDHDDPVPAGTRLYRRQDEDGSWRDLGVVTSWAYSFVLDTGLVLAYVKRRHQEPGTVFRLAAAETDPAAGAEARVVELPVRAGVAAGPAD